MDVNTHIKILLKNSYKSKLVVSGCEQWTEHFNNNNTFSSLIISH